MEKMNFASSENVSDERVVDNVAESAESKNADFELLKDLMQESDTEVYIELNASNNSAAQEEFIAHPEMHRPNNIYGKLKPELVAHRQECVSAGYQLLEESTSLSRQERDLSEIILDDHRRKNDFLQANIEFNSAMADNDGSDEAVARVRRAVERHIETNEALYGKPEKSVFYGLLKERIEAMRAAADTDEKRSKLDSLMERFGDIPEDIPERFKPKPETVEMFSEMVKITYGNFLDCIPETDENGEPKTEFTSEEAVDIIQKGIFEGVLEGGSGYTCAVSEAATNVSVSHEKRQIVFPKGKVYSRKRLSELVLHEVGAHTMRASVYIDAPIAELSHGLPDNETFDEGVAKCFEQAFNGKYADSGVEHYLNIGMATFMGMDFRDVYETQVAMRQILGNDKNPINLVQRCFRGTGVLPNNKDLAYYNGASRVWKFIEDNIDNPEELMDRLLLYGKSVGDNTSQTNYVTDLRMHVSAE